MKLRQPFLLLCGIALWASLASASNLTYICPGLTSATCNYLNNTVAAIYNNTFINANATIYVSVGSTGDVAESSYEWNGLSYTSYVADLTTKSTVDGSNGALASLSSYDTSVYHGSTIGVTAALGEALGISAASLFGVTSGGASCKGLSSTCFDGDVTLSSGYYSAGTDYTASSPGPFNIATEVEHETDEILGTGSCIGQNGSSQCGGTTIPSAVDLFRFSGSGKLVGENLITATPGAYFSFDGGLVNGAYGANYAVASGLDYADFSSGCTFVQDAAACSNANITLNINTDGPQGGRGPEIAILNVLGYNESAVATAPEPGTLSLLSIPLGAVLWRRRRTR